MRKSATGTVLAAFIDAPESVSRYPILIVHPLGEDDLEGFADRMRAVESLPPALQRVNLLRERSPRLQAFAGVDARRLAGIWEPFGIERAMRDGPAVKSASLPFDEGTALGRLPDPWSWNAIVMRPVPAEFRLRSACESLETFRDGEGKARIGWRLKVAGSADWVTTPTFDRDDLRGWSRRWARRSIGDQHAADALNLMIQTDADGGVEIGLHAGGTPA